MTLILQSHGSVTRACEGDERREKERETFGGGVLGPPPLKSVWEY
jgi:hypothetical protein